MSLLSKAKANAVGILHYLGDEAHRRFVVALVVWAVVHFGGKEIAPDVIDSATEAVVTGLAAMWSSRTPKLDDANGG
jgi:hypothetical protein